jgi:hypothetical protein
MIRSARAVFVLAAHRVAQTYRAPRSSGIRALLARGGVLVGDSRARSP